MTDNTDINPATIADIPRLKSMISNSELFEPDEISFMENMIADHFAQSAPAEQWLLSEHTAAYLAPEAMSDGAWNVLFIATVSEARSHGHGARMMKAIEDRLRASGARLLIVETSGTARFERTRAFYARLNYQQSGRISGYFGPDDDKVIFAKML